MSAALSAIAFSLANTVRGETERAATSSESVRAHYLAAGSVERAILHKEWGEVHRNPDGSPRYWAPGVPWLRYSYPTGEALVEFIPESSKLNINRANPADLQRLLLALGVPPEPAHEIVLAILDWRSPAPAGQMGPFDSFYLSRRPSFPARHASFEEIEDVLLVKGMTPELFYGGFDRDAAGRLVPKTGLRDCISVYGSTDRFDVNSVEPALMVAIGVDPGTARAIAEMRQRMPFRNMAQVTQFAAGAAGLNRLGFGGGTIFTLRATARPRTPNGQLSDLRRTVSALVKFFGPGYETDVTLLRWYDNAPVPARGF